VGELKRCELGHFYDSANHARCPYDGVQSIEFDDAPESRNHQDHRVPLDRDGVGDNGTGDQLTRRIALGEVEGGVDPVVGWLVCIHGPERGRDYRIHSENNMVGRSQDADIYIEKDKFITRGKHTVVTFDPQNNIFYLSPGEGQSIVYLNGKAVLTHQELKPYDEILIGASKLLFVPFCGEKYTWS
jgi:hypothetical protein